MLLHSNAVAENGATSVRTGGIDGDDADSLAGFAIKPRELINKRALARAGGAGEPDDTGFSGVREQNL
jgi:hypothetical protein